MNIARHGVIFFKKTTRRPEVKRIFRSSELLKKHAIRGTVLSLVPSEMTDIVVHHAHVDVPEVLRVASDSMYTSAFGTILSITLMATKYI